MLYTHDDLKNVIILKLIVEKLINEYDTKDNIILKHKIISILQDAARLKRANEEIYNIDSIYLKIIMYLCEYAPLEIYQNIQADIEKERLSKLLLLLNKIK